MRKVPLLVSVMTPFPYSVELDVTAAEALEVMREHSIHHLPVTRDHVAFSVVSSDAIGHRAVLSGQLPSSFKVAEVVDEDAELVDSNTPIDLVLDAMAERRLSCVVATRGEWVAGVFTPIDACRLLAKVLRGETPPDDVA